jgi:membrane associated rhomboid family serine protease
MIPISDTVPSKTPPVTTWLLILANSFVFFFELGISAPELQRFFYMFGVVPARYMHPEWAAGLGVPFNEYWPLLTSMFIHGGWLHIILNMWALWIFGDNVEDRMGPIRFFVFYMLCGLAGSALHLFMNPDSTIPAFGASAAIAGVMGAYLILFPFARIIVLVPILFFPLFFQVPAVVFIGFWALSQLFGGTISLTQQGNVGGIAWWGHIGGFGAGMLLQFFFAQRGNAYRLPSRDEYYIESAWVPKNYWRA